MDKDFINLHLDKAIYNHAKEIEVLTEVLKAVELYGDKVYNKRFITFVNNRLILTYGSKMYERYGKADEEIGNVYCYLTTEDYGIKTIRFKYVYEAKEVRRDYDTRKSYLGIKNEAGTLYNSDTLEDLKEAINGRIVYNNNLLKEIKSNKRNLDGLIKEHEALKSKVETYNNKLTYVLSEYLRIK